MQLGDEHRLDDDLGVRDERRRLGVHVAAEAEHRRRAAERLREVRQRRDADAAADEQRPRRRRGGSRCRAGRRRAISSPRLERAERPRARADRVDQERELAGRREAEAHRPRQQAAGRLEHEELARHARVEPAALDAQQRVRADRPRRATTLRRSRARVSTSIRSCSESAVSARAFAIACDRGRRAGERRDARDARGERRLADQVAVACARSAALRRVDDEVAAPRRIRSTTVGSPPASAPSHLLDVEPGRRAARARCPPSRRARSRARRAPPRPGRAAPCRRRAPRGTPCRSVGSGRPAARSAFANAVGKSAALAITSPVERISGPSTGSAPGKRANGSTAAFTLTCARRAARAAARARRGARPRRAGRPRRRG